MTVATTWYLENKSFEAWAYIDNFLSDEECLKVKDIANEHIREDALIDAGFDTSIRKNKVSFFNSANAEYQWLYRKITDAVTSMNEKFWQFDLDYIEVLQYTEYGKQGDKYKAHLDMGRNYSHYRKLSFTLLLDDPNDYSGGDFLVYTKSEPENTVKSKGTLIAFPSFILHEVTPIESGSRSSLVGWVCGPKFK